MVPKERYRPKASIFKFVRSNYNSNTLNEEDVHDSTKRA